MKIKIIECQKSIDFYSHGHLAIKDLCGTLSIAIQSCYAACRQKPTNIIKEIIIDNETGTINFEVKKTMETINYLNVLMAIIVFIEDHYPSSINFELISR